jgi:hypothetical protein
VNQKKRAIALMMLSTVRTWRASSSIFWTFLAAAAATSPKRTSTSEKRRSVCIGTWPARSWKMSGSGR